MFRPAIHRVTWVLCRGPDSTCLGEVWAAGFPEVCQGSQLLQSWEPGASEWAHRSASDAALRCTLPPWDREAGLKIRSVSISVNGEASLGSCTGNELKNQSPPRSLPHPVSQTVTRSAFAASNRPLPVPVATASCLSSRCSFFKPCSLLQPRIIRNSLSFV